MNLNFFSRVKEFLKRSAPSETSNTKSGTENGPENEIPKKSRKTKKITEPTVSVISVSQNQDMQAPESTTKSLPRHLTKQTRKWNGDEQQSIVNWIGCFKKDREIVDLFMEEYGKEISVYEVNYYRHADCWQSTIQKERERYSAQMFKVELANERKRIEKLQDIVERRFDAGDDKLAIAGLHEIHEQLKEASPLIQNNYQFNLYKDMTDEEFDRRELELLEKRKKIKEEIDASTIRVTTPPDGDRGTQPKQVV